MTSMRSGDAALNERKESNEISSKFPRIFLNDLQAAK